MRTAEHPIFYYNTLITLEIMDIVDTIQSPLIATTCYKRKDDLSINVLDTKDGPPGGVGAIRDRHLRASFSLVCRPSHP